MFFGTKSLRYSAYIYSTSQFSLPTFQVLTSLTWLVAAILDSTVETERQETKLAEILTKHTHTESTGQKTHDRRRAITL